MAALCVWSNKFVFRLNWSNPISNRIAKLYSTDETDKGGNWRQTLHSDSDNMSQSEQSGVSDSERNSELSAVPPPKEGAVDKVVKLFQKAEETLSGTASHSQFATNIDRKPLSFASVLRRSKLVEIGHPEGRVVVGTIIETLNDDLYIDFGGKFHCVCKRPQTRTEEYVHGAKVRIRLHDLEMSSRFLGAERDTTLLEADATLIGLHRMPRQSRNS